MSVMRERFASAPERLAHMPTLIQSRITAPDGYSVADLWEETVDKRGDAGCLVYVGDDSWPEQQLSFNHVDGLANQVAHWALLHGLQKGDSVALFFENRPEFVAIWLGFSKIGVVTAWINNAIKGQPLVHSIAVAAAKMLLFGSELAEAVRAVSGDLVKAGVQQLSVSGSVDFCKCLDEGLQSIQQDRPPRTHRKGVKYTDTMCYIYTSGTTGLPKASIISHARWIGVGSGGLLTLTPDDIVYGSGMPLYHSAAGMIGIGWMVVVGCRYIIRRKFSARAWVDDVKKYKATATQYIGELARYVLAVPEARDDGSTSLRVAVGNGMRPEYWDKFQLRFGIDVIIEFYGATEGTAGFNNTLWLDDLQKGDRTGYGAVGKPEDPNIVFCKFDVDQDELIRGSDGFCSRVAVDEPGEMLVKVTPGTQFAGYTNKDATQKKLITDVFEKGDMYTRTGDLLKADAQGFVYFVDRIGDTFRWKGENVSTAEVATELARYPGVDEVNVYGVQIPNSTDGRAGCVALVMPDTSEENLDRFYKHASSSLPSYSVPVFLRVLPQMQITGTFKHQKVQLRNEGIDLEKIAPDPLFVLENGKYRRVDQAMYQRVIGLQARL